MDRSRLVPAAGRPELLRIYLNDHLAGSAGGLAMARRLAAAHRGTAAESELADLARRVEADRDTLVTLMADLGIPRMRHKELVAVAAERFGRLKVNGTLVRRSPLSSLIELEAMELGVTGKAAGWRTLRELSESEPRLDAARLDVLIADAEQQIATLERLRVRAVTEALGREA